MNARRKHQGGWAGSFVIVGILLALLLVGGVYFLKSYEQDSGEIAAPAPSENKTTDEGDRNSPKDEASTNRQPSKESELPSGGQDVDESEAAHESLPETGPRETIFSSVILALVTYSTVAYVRSRRHVTL